MTIPANQIVQINPAVLSAGGTSLDINGVFLTTSTRVPIGAVQPFSSQTQVAAYFGPNSQEQSVAKNYFAGFDNSNIKPANLFFTQYNPTSVAAYLRGGTISGITIEELKLITGSITIDIDGYVWATAGDVDLSAITSYSDAASVIQGDLTASPPSEVLCNGSIGPQVATFNGSIAGNILTVTHMLTGKIHRGGALTGSGVTPTTITDQLSGITGGAGLYSVKDAQVVAQTSMSEAYGLLTVTGVTSGFIQPGQTVTGSNAIVGTLITELASGTGGVGTYYVNKTQTVAANALTFKATVPTVTYDSTTKAFVIKSSVVGEESTVIYATGSGALVTTLNLTSSKGGVLSQGAYSATPSAFMDRVSVSTGDWATFMTLFDPDGEGGDNTQKLLFAQWTAGTNNRYAYICWDTDEAPAITVPATESLGYILANSESSGTYLMGNGIGAGQHGQAAAVTANYAAFICGAAASIDFTELNGRITFAFRSQSGLLPTAIDGESSANLLANGYNFYGAYATANQKFIWNYNGQLSGQFLWLDSYINQIWLNANLQSALMVLLMNAKSIPYNTAGYSMVAAACTDPIKAALNFGAIRTGIPLSQEQTVVVNTSAGVPIDSVLTDQGYYLQVLPASPQVRQKRASPPVTLFYMDGQSIQQINLASIELV